MSLMDKVLAQTKPVDQKTKTAGEDQVEDRLLISQRCSLSAKSADGQVGTAGRITAHGYIVTATSSGVFALYDGTSTAGVRIIPDTTPTVGDKVFFSSPINCTTGLWFELVSGTITVNVLYSQ